jgi:hypothetical protein
MADEKSTNQQGTPKAGELEPFAKSFLYQLRRDALFIVSSLNRGRSVETETMKRQLVFVQAQLCAAAVADPRLSQRIKAAVMKFQAATIAENLQDRRGARRRAPSVAMGVAC